MQRAMAHYVPCEMAVLGLIEFALGIAVIYPGMHMSGTPVWFIDIVGTPPGDSIAIAALIALSIGLIGLIVGLYRLDVCLNRRRLLPATGLAAALAFAVLLIVSGLTSQHLTFAAALQTGRVFAAWLATMTTIRLVHGSGVVQRHLARRVLFLGDAGQIDACNLSLRSHRGRRFKPITMPPGDITRERLRGLRMWGVVLASGVDGRTAEILLDCKLRGLRILGSAAFHEHYLGRIDLGSLTVDDLLLSDGFSGGRAGAALKRGVDIIVSIMMLLVTLPLMAAVALAIKIDSCGPVFYRQQRVGLFGEIFTLFKFRSMTADAEACGKPRWAQTQDPRVTRVGRVIRASRIDELPQLVNIIHGDMSLVGPRPERPHFVDRLTQAIPFYQQRAYVKPGLTGWAQVNFPYGASVEDAREKLAYDLYYVKHRTVWLDFVILLSTIRVVLFREGAR